MRFLRLFTLLSLLGLTFGCIDRRYERVPQQLGLPYATRTIEDRTVTIAKDNYTLIFTMGSRICTINGVCYYLHAPAGEDTLNKLDCRILRESLIATMQPRPKLTLLLDAGHGGTDAGCTYGDAKEKEIALAVTLEVKRLLEEKGHTIHLTRADNTTTLTLDQRSLAATGKQLDAFISIHVNAALNPETHGVEVFTIPAPGCEGSLPNSPARPPMIGQRYLLTATRLAFAVQRQLLGQSFKPLDRGVKHAHFKVLRDTPAPSILIETGFLSNATEAQRLTNEALQKETAQAIARGIEDAFTTPTLY